jgi:hypothetical protein
MNLIESVVLEPCRLFDDIDRKRDEFVRVQCGRSKCQHTVGIVYMTPAGPMYAGVGSLAGDWSAEERAQFYYWFSVTPRRDVVRELGKWMTSLDRVMLRRTAIDDEYERIDRFALLTPVIDFPLSDTFDHKEPTSWCPDHRTVRFDWADVIAALDGPRRPVQRVLAR